MQGAVEQVAPGAPVAAGIEQDIFVLSFCLGLGSDQVFGGIAGWVEDIFGRKQYRCGGEKDGEEYSFSE